MSKYVIETKNLTKQYGTQKSVADLNIHVKQGRIYGLLGRNGAGKTTTMKMLLGLTQPLPGSYNLGTALRQMRKSSCPDWLSDRIPDFYPNLTARKLRIFCYPAGSAEP